MPVYPPLGSVLELNHRRVGGVQVIERAAKPLPVLYWSPPERRRDEIPHARSLAGHLRSGSIGSPLAAIACRAAIFPSTRDFS